MKKFTIFGNPVSHSKSPQMHNAGFKTLGFDGEYSKTHLENGDDIKKVFLEGGFSGANITVPHKEYAYRYADSLDPLAKKIGAVNTYINDDGKIKGYNTDAFGFYKSIEKFEDVNSILILGAGGTAKSIAVILKEKNFDVTVLNRSENSKDFFIGFGCEFYNFDNFPKEKRFDLIVNSTSAGLSDQNYPAPLELLESLIKDSKYAVDCIYGKMTPFLELAKKHFKIYKDGEDMLLFQGVIAFELFTNTKANQKLIQSMREGLKKID
ncbi:MAG: shikimate dehydrogenase [Arcobacteraceae bacterium]|jgi:shikimate dehydrogenase|nr:shikimate dehydrogenase [Arcobacteraceae bacterium]